MGAGAVFPEGQHTQINADGAFVNLVSHDCEEVLRFGEVKWWMRRRKLSEDERFRELFFC